MTGSRSPRVILGVDIGGTFTDLALLDRASGRITAGKILTDYDDFARGVLTGTERILSDGGAPARAVESVRHGTTLATNALIERRGAKTALIVTAGFRDLLETGRGTRYDIFDLNLEMPEPLVPRSRVFEVDERIDHSGAVVRALDGASVRRLATRLVADGIESVAICLMHSYVNPDHERAIAAIIAKQAPNLAVSLSASVVPAIGEYERASTTVANVYLEPVIRGYLERLQAALSRLGVPREMMVVTSDGGLIDCTTAARFPVRLIESGPAGGAIATAYFAQRAQINRAIGFDMGGTTAKICIVEDFEPARTTEFEAARIERFRRGSGLPLKVPAVDMIEIGAGGGSIARVDRAGLLKVGPDSAGAAPGPACYGLGGSAPTVTDADLCLGYLDPKFFLGGDMRLDQARAEAAIARLAGELKLEPIRAAWGIHEVVNNNMARAAKIHCMEKGRDARLYTLVAFGGAGPIHAYGIARSIGIPRILYPTRAGIMSAVGFLVARPSFELFRSCEDRLGTESFRRSRKLFAEMEEEGRALLGSAGVAADAIEIRSEVGIRYLDQAYVLFVRAPQTVVAEQWIAEVERAFASEYHARYHRTNAGVPLELVSLRAQLSGPRAEIELSEPGGAEPDRRRALKGERAVYAPERGVFLACPVFDRYALSGRLTGPAVIEERESTVIIGAGASVDIDQDNNLLVTLPSHDREPAGANRAGPHP